MAADGGHAAQYEEQTLQFINISDQAKLSKPEHTKIRSHVMLAVHRRKRFGANENDGGVTNNGSEKIGKKGQINKMKLAPKGLQQWVPRKRSKKNAQVSQGIEVNGHEDRRVTSECIIPKGKFLQENRGRLQNGSSDQASSRALVRDGAMWDDDMALDGVWAGAGPLRANPSTGSMDPFNAVSLLISPKTQSLIHYYCKSPLFSVFLSKGYYKSFGSEETKQYAK